MDPVIIVGAGISGLVTAVELVRLGVDVAVYEMSSRAGGVIHSLEHDGFLFESGPNTIAAKTDAIPNFLHQLGVAGALLNANREAKKRYLFARGKLRAVGPNPLSFFTSGILSPRGLFRLFAEPFVPAKRANGADESLSDFVARRMGAEVVRYLVGPFVSGVYAGDPGQLSVDASFPLLKALERRGGSLVGGGILTALGKRKGPRTKRRMLSFPNGLGQMIAQLADHLGERLHLNSPVSAVSSNGGTPQVEFGSNTVAARAVVLATPVGPSANLLRANAPELASVIGEIESPPLCVVHLGFRRQQISHPLDGFGFLAARGEGLRTLGCLFSSTLFPNRAPVGSVALTAFIGGAQDREITAISDSAVLNTVTGELGRVLGIEGAPSYSNILRYEQAIPQYNLGHNDRMQQITRHLSARPGLYLAGNYIAGPAIEERVTHALELARSIARAS